ncbi:MAG: hypothetical protein KME42_12075 [Tildeniella nuda ZEHNDER 1965/U140]|jgi:hypothetical protein|nr:hypothetical protein [Tildeniella nuda ZEHNDER 1965/U140]
MKSQDSLGYKDEPKPPHKLIWQVAREIRQNLSAEDLQQLPTDGAVNHDHYVYGIPKAEP